jgi:predicted acylesterase/phospholipase RssA
VVRRRRLSPRTEVGSRIIRIAELCGARDNGGMSVERDIGLVLSGGGINAVLLELGFLQVVRAGPLWERVGWVYGTSAGALSGMMAALDRLDDLEEFMMGLQPEDVFSPNPLWQAPLGGLRGYALPATIADRLGPKGAFAAGLAGSSIELTVIATDVGIDDEPGDRGDRHHELVYSSRTTPPETMIRAVLASAAVSALVLPIRIDEETIATDGGWVRNLPLAHAYANPRVRAITGVRYVASYGPSDPAALARFRERLERFRAAPPVKALISELAASERRSERGEPAHLGEMIVRLMRIAIARNTVLEERLADERDTSVRALASLRGEVSDLAVDAAPPWRRRALREAIDRRFREAGFPFGGERALPRLVVRADPGEHALDPGFRQPWPDERKRGLVARGRELAERELDGWWP